MDQMGAIQVLLLVLMCSLPGLPSALPMTDYSQLNHDEPTHWTKAATTEGSVLWRVRGHLASEPRRHPRPRPTPQTPPPTDTIRMVQDERRTTEIDYSPSPDDERRGRIPATSSSSSSSSSMSSMGSHSSTTVVHGEQTTDSSPAGYPEDRTDIASNGSAYEDRRLAYPVEHDWERDRKTVSPDVSSTWWSTGSPPEGAADNNYLDREPAEEKNYFEDDSSDKKSSDVARSSNSSDAEQFYRYDAVDDGVGDRKDDTGKEVDDGRDYFRGPESISPLPTYKTVLIHKVDDLGGFDSEQEEEEMKKDDSVRGNALYDSLAIPTMGEGDDTYDSDTPFKEWDRDSEEQEKMLENIVLRTTDNETSEGARTQTSVDPEDHPGRWFILLLAGNSTIVKLRQKDFAKYLKLNLAARLSLEYDELRVNRVVVAPPRLMVNVSVVPSEVGNLDEEFDINERIFGEEEAPLHKLAETNATLLELSGEEYHVVRFLSLRSEQPVSLEEAASETSVVVTDKHTDIEKVIYIGVGGACIIVIIPLVFALCRLYVVPRKIKWPWINRDKPLWGNKSGPRHERMEEPAPIGGPLTVIYSGSFVERNGPPSGSWLEDNYQNSSILQEEPSLENPVYGYSALNRSVLPEICDPTILESPRFNIDSKLHILGCRPNHLLIPHTPVKRPDHKNTLDVRIPKGLDNPNYQT